MGQPELKGLSEPVDTFVVNGERLTETRFAARQPQRLATLVGRDQELALLRDRWKRAKQGEGQMVFLSGEAGIGKSRISRSLVDSLAEENHIRITYQCSPYHSDSALYPAIQQLSRSAGIRSDDSVDDKLDKLEELLALSSDNVGAIVPLIAALIEIDPAHRYGPLNLLPAQQRAKTFTVLIDQLIGLTRRGPVLFLVEDAHWIDPTTLELVEQVLARIESASVLVVMTARPVFNHAIAAHPLTTRLTLNRVGRQQIASIAERVAGGRRLPTEVIEEIVTRTDGVPLFVEELTKTFLESGILRQNARDFELVGSLDDLIIPSSLHDSLMDRLDRLRPVKEVAQMASCIGREFSHQLLAAISPLAPEGLDDALAQLMSAELLFRRGAPPEASYIFKHALVRDAAYESLLRSKRQALHAALLEALQCQDAAVPELLAHHATEAGLWETAAANWLQAGRSANSRSAFAEAIAHLEKGLQVLSKTPNSTQRARREIELRSVLATAMISARGYGAPEAEENFDRALELSNDVGNLSQRFVALHGLWWFNLVARSIARSRKIGDELQAISKKAEEIELQIAAHRALGYSCWLHADFKTGLEHCRQGLSLYDHEAHGALASRFGGADPGVALNTLSANCHWYLGQPDQSLQFVERNTGMFSSLNHPLSECWGRVSLAQIHLLRGERDATERGAARVLQLAQELSLPTYVGWAMALYGWSLLGTGNEPDSVDKIREGIRVSIGTGTKALVTIWRCLLAEAAMKKGDHVACLAALDGAEALVSETQERLWAAELLRLRGLLHLARDGRDTPLAEECFQRAIETARRQDAKSWELRAATSLARLWAEEGERGKAVDLLAPVFQWFTEGHDTRDLKNARAQLDAMT
ncbi:MAG: AAA family ATPase [Pseudomonadota bacterium]